MGTTIAGKGIVGIEQCVVVNTNCGRAGNHTKHCNFMHIDCWFTISSYFLVLYACLLIYNLFTVDYVQTLLSLMKTLTAYIIYKVCLVLLCSGYDVGYTSCIVKENNEGASR